VKRIYAVMAVLVMAATAAAVSSAGTESHAAVQKYCPPAPKTAKATQVPIWVLLEVRTSGGLLVKDVAFTVRRYSGGSSYTEEGWAYSGCWSVLLYGRRHTPGVLCITVRNPYKAPTGPCQRIRSGPTGQKEVRFLLTS
jgi:hypothetical protein